MNDPHPLCSCDPLATPRLHPSPLSPARLLSLLSPRVPACSPPWALGLHAMTASTLGPFRSQPPLLARSAPNTQPLSFLDGAAPVPVSPSPPLGLPCNSHVCMPPLFLPHSCCSVTMLPLDNPPFTQPPFVATPQTQLKRHTTDRAIAFPDPPHRACPPCAICNTVPCRAFLKAVPPR